MAWKLPLFKMHWDEQDISAVTDVLRRGEFWAAGPEITTFEEKLAIFSRTKHALTFNSGTTALLVMFLAADVKDGEIIIPSFTFIATANAVVLAGGTPVFAEIEPETYALDAADVERRITTRTKGIVVVNYAGCPARDLEKLREVADKHKILFFEDNAHAYGARINGKLTGSFSDAAALSFCQNKLITTGEGGAVVTNNEALFEKMKLLRSHGRVEEMSGDYFSTTKEMEYISLGYNFRLPTMCAALGISQLEKFADVTKLRVDAAAYLNKALSKIPGVTIPQKLPNADHFYQMYTIRLADRKTRDALQKHMSKDGILTKVYYAPIHLKTYYRQQYGCKEGNLPTTEKISDTVLTLPFYPDITNEEMDLMIRSIRTFFEKEGDERETKR